MFCLVLVAQRASAGLILGAELRFTYEDNVVGLLSDQQPGRGGTQGIGMSLARKSAAPPPGVGRGGNNRYLGTGSAVGQSPGDYSISLSAEAGGYTDWGRDTTLFAKGFASHTGYGTYTDLDETDLGGSTGMVVSLSDVVTARLALVGRLKRFGDSNRDSTAYAADAGLKEKLTSRFWLREFVEYEKNDADSAFFSYTGTTIDIGAGYSLLRTTTLTAGGRYLDQKYDEPAGATVDTWTGYAAIDHALAQRWALSGEYDRQVSKLSVTGTSNTDNILSFAVRYVY